MGRRRADEARPRRCLCRAKWRSAKRTLDFEKACGRKLESSRHAHILNPVAERESRRRYVESTNKRLIPLCKLTQAGKTVLASVIVEECQEDKSFATIFFYCKHDDPEKKNCNSILKSLLSQLVTQCRDLVPHFYDKYLASGELTLNSAKLIKQLLELCCDSLAKQYIIIDGLDECSKAERNLVMSFFNSLVDRHDTKAPGKTRILFVSQDEFDIEKGLSTAAVIRLNPTDNESDIRWFVRESCMEIQTTYELDNLQVADIMESTCVRAKGAE